MPDVDLPLPFEAYTGDEAFVFVSYAHLDGHRVYPEIQALHEQGFRIWYDEGIDPGNEWPEEIAAALGRAAAFLVFISPAAAGSDNVRNEIHFALNRRKRFVAVHLEETELPEGLELRMGSIQGILKWRMTAEHYRKKLALSLPVVTRGAVVETRREMAQSEAAPIESAVTPPPPKPASSRVEVPPAQPAHPQAVVTPPACEAPSRVAVPPPPRSAAIVVPQRPPVAVPTGSPAAGATQINPVDGAEMVYVPAGPFLRGDADQSDNPRRTVTLDAFWMYKTPVTVAQYRNFCQVTGRAMPTAPSWGWKKDHPMVNVNWEEAAAYCGWAESQLPTEAQWEKAARGTDGWKYPWGNDWDPGKLQCSKKDWGDAKSTAPVGSFPAGASPYGCLDMAGNVWEWCEDWYDVNYLKGAPTTNPTGPATGERRVLRGGSWIYDNGPEVRCALRDSGDPAVRNDDLGFRAGGGVRAD